MKSNEIETLIGALVIIVAVTFGFFAYKTANLSNIDDGYVLKAKFDRVDGLNIGGDVRISGLKVGSIVSQTLDPISYQAIIEMELERSVQLPRDSSAEIIGDGLLGSKYVALIPGADDDMLQPGESIQFTQSSISFESLIGKFMFGGGEEKAAPTPTESKP